MPFKQHTSRRYHIETMKFRASNWREYEDAPQVDPLLDHIDGPIGQFTDADAYDGRPTYDTVINHSTANAIVIPPRANAVEPIDSPSRPKGPAYRRNQQ